MKRILVAASILSFALAGFGHAQSTSTQGAEHYSNSQLKQLTREAHTADQYKVLESYYMQRQQEYLRQAAEEKQEWVRRQNVMSVAAKYPTPVDSAHNLYEYFAYRASEAGSLSAKYSQLAGAATPAPMP